MIKRTQHNEKGLFSNRHAQDSCGVGWIVAMDGQPRRQVLDVALASLANVEHRGAIGADGKTADGAGVLTTIPQRLLKTWLANVGCNEPADCIGVGMFFLDAHEQRADEQLDLICEIVEKRGLTWLGTRNVPVDSQQLGQLALDSQPRICQVFVQSPNEVDEESFERQLFVLRKLIEQQIAQSNVPGFSIASLSCRKIVYKAMVRSMSLGNFYLDLQNIDYDCSICLYHQRYSTNTLPSWALCQPFRFAAHNGEINTITGNRNWMLARQSSMEHEVWGDDLEKIGPIVNAKDSDSCSLDNVLELLSLSGRSLSHALSMLLPPAWQTDPRVSIAQKSFYEYHASFCEPWDGPAAIASTDGVIAVAGLDRNGLRPLRYKVTDDGLMVLGSEVGSDRIDEASVIQKGRLGPGEIIKVDTIKGEVLKHQQILDQLASANPYSKWLVEYRHTFQPWSSKADHEFIKQDADGLKRVQVAAGLHQEEIDIGLIKMAESGSEPTFSMGVDTPLAVMSNHPRLLTDYFKQRFAQVTNPPIDPIRERSVMSLMAGIGPEQNLLAESPRHCRVMNVENAVLLPSEIDQILLQTDYASVRLDCTWSVADGEDGLEKRLDELCERAINAVKNRAGVIVLSDRAIRAERVAIPMTLAIGAVHHALCNSGFRMQCSLVAESAEVRDPHQLALHFGYGATVVYPYLAFATISQLLAEAKIEGNFKDIWNNYRSALNNGLMKIMSKSGISVLNSYQGAQIFEALGIGKPVMQKCFPGTDSPIQGIDFTDIAASCLQRHAIAFESQPDQLSLLDLGFTKPRRQGESHAINGHVTKNLHSFVKSNDHQKYDEFQNALDPKSPIALRHLLAIKKSDSPKSIDEVEPIETIRRRFTTAAMSLGAISPEAHEAIAIAMNTIGGKSNSGEGGEDPARFIPNADGTSANSKIKQVASGRFGVNAHYLANAEEIEIKMAQGAKPGEGGQLPGFKVNELIARLRNTEPGVTLISPPPHHDIYSIEDLAQLIYDLKMVNPRARVCVKLVAKSGVGGIAIGCVKAGADVILISGHEGGTGASPLTSIKHAGMPWEIGLAETHQALVCSGFRNRVILRVDGGIRTGRDIIHAAILGADEFNFGTMALIALGCVYVKKCHLNNCPVGIATQDPKYREKFKGKPENLINYLNAVADECRHILAQLGHNSVDEIVGQTQLLQVNADLQTEKTKKLDLSRLLDYNQFAGNWSELVDQRPVAWDSFDDQIIANIQANSDSTVGNVFELNVNNTDRNIGTRLSGWLATQSNGQPARNNSVQLNLSGTAGQSLGAFLCPGITVRVVGEANDYVGKGMSGGEIVLRPRRGSRLNSWENIIAGNTLLYGATGGKLFAAGQVAERFCVRNSGAIAVVEGCGDHGCEYMTRGTAVILGPVGNNFAAGMTGGEAFILDTQQNLQRFCNLETVEIIQPTGKELVRIKQLIGEFAEKTLSVRASQILQNWSSASQDFRQVKPKPVPQVQVKEDKSNGQVPKPKSKLSEVKK